MSRNLPTTDDNAVVSMVVEYYDWLSDNGGTAPDSLLERCRSHSQRRLLLEAMNDVNIVYGITASIRNAACQPAQVEHIRPPN